jgi:hypothetical protein
MEEYPVWLLIAALELVGILRASSRSIFLGPQA